jgi:hypothetical protein
MGQAVVFEVPADTSELTRNKGALALMINRFTKLKLQAFYVPLEFGPLSTAQTGNLDLHSLLISLGDRFEFYHQALGDAVSVER